MKEGVFCMFLPYWSISRIVLLGMLLEVRLIALLVAGRINSDLAWPPAEPFCFVGMHPWALLSNLRAL